MSTFFPGQEVDVRLPSQGRGVLRVGLKADVVVFDPDGARCRGGLINGQIAFEYGK